MKKYLLIYHSCKNIECINFYVGFHCNLYQLNLHITKVSCLYTLPCFDPMMYWKNQLDNILFKTSKIWKHDVNRTRLIDKGCKWDTTSQWCYFRKGLHVLLPKNHFFIQMNFWTIFKKIIIISDYNFPSTSKFFKYNFE